LTGEAPRRPSGAALAVVFVAGLATGVGVAVGYAGKQAADATVLTFEDALEPALRDLRTVATRFYPNFLALWVAYYHYASGSVGGFADVAEDIVVVLQGLGGDALDAVVSGSITLEGSVRAMDEVIRGKPREIVVPWAAVKASLDAARRLQQIYVNERGGMLEGKEQEVRALWWQHFWAEMRGQAAESQQALGTGG
jgi:hypothetical protein